MIRKTKIKIFLGSAILVFFVFFLSSFSPLFAATDSNISELYANPNQSNGKNPYKFKVSDVVNSSLLTEVVGCTGVVNKVSTWMLKFVQSPVKQAEITAQRVEDYRKKLKDNCSIIRAGLKLVGDAIPGIGGTGDGASSATETQEECKQRVDAKDDQVLEQEIKQTEKMNESAYKEQCFDGIAIKLAKNQLTAMTRSAVNWVNSGYGGNPFYVQNMDNFAFNMNKSILTGGISTLRDETKAYPFGSAFSESAISIYKRTSAGNFLDSLTSDLGSFITIPDSTNGYGEIPSALERAKRANDIFANDFSSGGWNAWLALTQRDQNNPLGFTMQTAQHLAEEQAKKATNVTNELNRNGGFLDQKVCTLWQIYDNYGKPLKMPNPNYYLSGNGDFYTPEQIEPETIYVYRETKSGSGYDVCAPNGWKTLTPGGVIKEKTISYLNSPERQLELADTINESLNALFSILISKLEGSGLSGLSDSVVTTNWTDTMNEFDTDDSSPYNNNGAYGSFNLTRDLGNTFIHDDVYKAGTWNASLNLTNKNDTLIMNYAPSFGDKTSNIYWEVTTAGNAKLIENGHNVWEVGDRAFWDGSRWQNWKCGKLSVKGGRDFQCPNQISPIDRRGVIQVQKDYIVAAKEILKVLPNILSKMGELDYCLPGPNPSYKINSSEVESAYQTWIGSLYVGPKDADRHTWRIDDINSRTYKNFASFFDDSPNTWKNIRNNYSSMNWLLGTDQNGSFGNGGYEYNPNDNERERIRKHERWANGIREYVSNNWFKNFYESFDKIVTTLYYKSSTNKFLEKENTSIFEPNPSYIEMAESGYSLTKDIAFYDEDIKKASEEYREAISQAQINISKLEPIKAEVSKIILAAQDRRDAKLVEIINEQTNKLCNNNYAKCMSDGYGLSPEEISRITERGQLCNAKKQICEADKLTAEEYKTKYAQCLDEENIQVYDPDELLNPSEYDRERCYNSFDDDLDGLVDMKDPDCSNTGGGGSGGVIGGDIPPDPSSGCFLDLTDRIKPTNQPNSLYRCEERDYETCTETPYIINKTQQLCYWNGLPQ